MTAFFFPGQGSQSVGMLSALAERFPIIQATFAESSEAIGLDLWAMAQNGPDTELNRTENTQPALLAASVALYRAWLAAGGAPASVMAGHSLGEYSALVCAEALSLADATRLVRLRGQAMQRAVSEGVGAMAAVLNADLALIEQACLDVTSNSDESAHRAEIVAPANLNAPGQIVISGHASAMDRALKLLAERGARKAIKLPVSVPSHCALMQPAAIELAQGLKKIALQLPRIPVLHNVSAACSESLEALESALIEQLVGRVRWIETVQRIAETGVQKALECGPGKALTGMVKRIEPALLGFAIAEPAGFDEALTALKTS